MAKHTKQLVSLSPEEQGVLLDWHHHCASMGCPYRSSNIHAKAKAISGKEIRKMWHKKFEHHHPELQPSKPSKS